jgi:hypothetical protein
VNAFSTTASDVHFDNLHVIGVNADMTFGPATIKPAFAYQFGKTYVLGDTVNRDEVDVKAWMAQVVAKIKAGPGAVNLAGFYLTGADEGDNDFKAWQNLSAGTTYFNPANMWLLIRNGQQINSSTSVLGNDMTVGGHGSWFVGAGYEGTMDKWFYNANIGYMKAVEKWADEKTEIGTEFNAQVGYKLFDNLSLSVAAAYLMLGDGLKSDTAGERLYNIYGKVNAAGDLTTQFGANDADDPFMFNVQLSYTF